MVSLLFFHDQRVGFCFLFVSNYRLASSRCLMHQGGVFHSDVSNSPGFPEKNLMSRDDPVKENQKTEEKQGSCLASERLFSWLFNAFPCFQINRDDFQKEDFSVASISSSFSASESMGKAIKFTMAELSKATSNFSPSCKIGEGGFGHVYKGRVRDGTIVAIKRARKDMLDLHRTAQFQSEVKMLASVEHLNLVRLIGFLEEGSELILVQEFVGNGNLRQHLDCELNVTLDLFQRLDIAIDVAHALTYLHLYADRPIIHRDVKASNILLTETFRAKVADFGFSRTGPFDSEKTHVSTKVKGTAGYLDPEYLKTYKLTTKSDVYAFGILLVELLTGRRPIEASRGLEERITVRWAYKKFLEGHVSDVIDAQLEKTDVTCRIMDKMFELAFWCSAPTKHDRPTMKEAGECLWSMRKDCQLETSSKVTPV